jgi:N-acetylglutamate synthase/N-acetylornithine aminotransferase
LKALTLRQHQGDEDHGLGPGQDLVLVAQAASFNRITMDGDISTNDTVLVLASGQAGHPPISEMEPAAATLGKPLAQLLS